MCESSHVRFRAAAAAGVIAAGSLLAAPPAAAGPTVCDVPDCTPGIMPGVVLGSPCDQHHLLRLRGDGLGTAGVLRLAQAV